MFGVLQQFKIGRRRRFERVLWVTAKASNEWRARSGPRYCATVSYMLHVTVVRQRRNVGVIGASPVDTNRSACKRSIEDGCRASESTM